jgi:hypothetical protein
MAAAITTTATTLEGQAFEILNALQDTELAQPEATRPNRVTVAYDTEALTVTLGLTMNITPSSAGGSRTFTPLAYLP